MFNCIGINIIEITVLLTSSQALVGVHVLPGERGEGRGQGRDGGVRGGGGLHQARVRHDGLGEAGDDVAGVGVGQYLGLRHVPRDVCLTTAVTEQC